jgi:serine/threonine protein kinase
MVRLEGESFGTAKILDLGLAKAVGESHSQTAISIPGAFVGTPEFASPEQLSGVGVDIRSDLVLRKAFGAPISARRANSENRNLGLTAW